MRINWENLTISGKEFLYVVTFLFSMSGFFYKFYYEDKDSKQQSLSNYQLQNQQIELIKADVKLIQLQIRELQDAELKRSTREDQAVEKQSDGYVPLYRKRSP